MFSYIPLISEINEQQEQSLVTSHTQLELQHKIQTLDEIPEISTHHLSSLTHWRQAPPPSEAAS